MWTLQIRFSILKSSRSLRLNIHPQDGAAAKCVSRPRFLCKRNSSSCYHLLCGKYLSRRCLHTIKGWKLVANPKLAESDESFGPFVACEEGSDAVPHKELLACLNTCGSLGEQVYTLSSLLSLTQEDLKKRREFSRSLAEVFRIYFPDCKVTQYGSGMNLLGFRGSDVDVCFRTAPDTEKIAEYSKTYEIPTLDDVISGTVDHTVVANLHPKLLLRFLRRAIRKHCKEVREPIFLVKARCPLLRFYHEKYDLYCDFSCENLPALRNTKLLRLVAHADSRVRPLIQVLRYWGKIGRFVGDIDLFNSYAFSLMAVYYLQNTTPPVLPPLEELLAKADYLNFGEVEDDDLLFKSLKSIPVSQNKQSIEELLRGYFFFYSFYDFKRVMLLLSASSVPTQEFQSPEGYTDIFEMGSVCLQDPYRRSLNATAGLSYKSGGRFLNSLIEACLLFQSDNALIPNSESVNWGLSQLFETAMYPPQEMKSVSVHERVLKDSFTVDLQSCGLSIENSHSDILVKASNFLKKLFEHCFLFSCQEMPIRRHKYKVLPLIKFSCESSLNVWVGRDRVLKEKFLDLPGVNSFELEHLISVELAQDRVDHPPVLFKLICECYQGDMDASSLQINYHFVSAKSPTVISIFLKEHVPRIMKSALSEIFLDKCK